MSKLIPNDYGELLAEVKQWARSAQYEALRAVNKELISLFWDIGRLIEEKQAGKSWGKAHRRSYLPHGQKTDSRVEGASAVTRGNHPAA